MIFNNIIRVSETKYSGADYVTIWSGHAIQLRKSPYALDISRYIPDRPSLSPILPDIKYVDITVNDFERLKLPALQVLNVRAPFHVLNRKHLSKSPINTLLLYYVAVPSYMPTVRRLRLSTNRNVLSNPMFNTSYEALNGVRELILEYVKYIDYTKLPSSISHLTIIDYDIDCSKLYNANQLNLEYLRIAGDATGFARSTKFLVLDDRIAKFKNMNTDTYKNLKNIVYNGGAGESYDVGGVHITPMIISGLTSIHGNKHIQRKILDAVF